MNVRELKSGTARLRRTAQVIGSASAAIDGSANQTAEALERSARAAGHWISGDLRIGEADLAALLGLTAASLANKRREGSGPPAFELSGGGHRVTYRLWDAALWIESHKVK